MISLGLELHQVGETDTPMLAGPVEGQGFLFEQLDQVWSRHIEHVGSLLGRELGMYWYYLDGIACGESRQDLQPAFR